MLQALLWDIIAEGRGTADGSTPAEDAAATDPVSASGTPQPRGAGGQPPVPAARRPGRDVGRHDYNVHVDRAVQLFERHVTEAITISEVARRLGVTPAHLTRLFDRHLGVSPLQYYRRLRMEVAASLLINTARSIKEISFELGFANPFHFSRSFSRFAEISPSEFRRQYYRNNPTGYAGKIVGDA
jgi:transcriptional regulator GlxA family with amidase domain